MGEGDSITAVGSTASKPAVIAIPFNGGGAEPAHPRLRVFAGPDYSTPPQLSPAEVDMARLSQRISAVWNTVRCPRCNATVDPGTLVRDGIPARDSEAVQKRWSFIWVQPRGDFCPECEFPLSKYFGRLKWIRTLMVGVAVLVVFFVLQFIVVIRNMGTPLVRVMQVGVFTGALVAMVGIVGPIVGGKHGRIDAAEWSGSFKTRR